MQVNLHNFYGLIRISGEDAQTFIQNQFSNDISLVSNEMSQLSSYNSPKGRVYAVLRIVKLADYDYLLLTAQDQIDFLVKRLSLFVLRAKVKVENATHLFTINGLHFPDSSPADYAQLALHAVHTDKAIRVIKIDTQDRYIQLTTPSTSDDDMSLAHWLAADISIGLPHIGNATTEMFVAQMLNLDLLKAINFQKGCYPGQEVVARMKYLGKLKKRAYAIRWQGASVVAGSDIHTTENDQAIGQIVYSSEYQAEQHCALAVLNIDVVQEKLPLFIKTPAASIISIEVSKAFDTNTADLA